VQLDELDTLLHTLLLGAEHNPEASSAVAVDPALNGLQVGRRGVRVSRVACAVDACAETFRRAADWGAQLLFVHHGLFWGQPVALVAEHLNRVRLLLEHDLALYGCHLPLDCHPIVGNNARMAELLGLQRLQPFGEFHGARVGVQGRLAAPTNVADVAATLFGGEANCLAVLPFGAEAVSSIALVSGGGTRDLQAAIDDDVDLFVTGDAAHQTYHAALEAQINVISGGHYRSEVFGVQAVAGYLSRNAQIETTFIDLETGL
jgi:dinuclear metal center YbgI/SA1388 family protein